MQFFRGQFFIGKFVIQSFTRRLSFGVFGLLALLISYPLWQLQAQSNPKPKIPLNELKHNEEFGFVTMRTPTGSECRPLSASEARTMRLQARETELHSLSDNTLRSTQQTGLVIQLQGTPQLENFPQAKAAFQRAAAKWQNAIKTQMTIKLDVDFGTTRFGTPYANANIIGSTDPVLLQGTDSATFPNPYRFFRDAALDIVTDAQQIAFLTALPTGGLPTELGTIRNASASVANLRGLQLLDDSDLGGFTTPSIGFNSAIEFDFDPSDGIDNNKIDFESTAVHEIGHALGFSSFVGFKELSVNTPVFPTPWDYFRFRNNPLDFNIVATRPRALMAGGTQTYFIGDEYSLSTATPTATNGDGRQASHWKDDLISGQFVGIMDPTAANGDREETTFSDLLTLSYMGYVINPDVRSYDIQSVADASIDETQDRPNALVVNRYFPQRYPARLEGVRILMPLGSEAGQQIRLVAFVDNNRTGQPPASPSLILNQTVTIPALPATRYVEFRFATPPTINSGDVYIGLQTATSNVRFAADTSRPQGRSWVSTNDGGAWSPFGSLNNVGNGANFMARALFTATYGSALAPQTVSLSPNIVAPSTANVTLFVEGRNFQRGSVIRWNGTDRTTTYLTNTRLSTVLQAADVANAGTAQVRVFTTGGTESGALTFTVGQNNPVPTITFADPPNGQTGASSLALNVYGTNFNANSRVRINGNERTTTFRNSTQLEAALTSGDLASTGTLQITVVNPTPGGGTSNNFPFGVSGCTFSFANTSGATFSGFLLTSSATSNGFTLNVGNGTCGWTATSTESWLTLTGQASGTGRSVINFAATENTSAIQRTAQIRINNQTFDIRQAGRVANVSAASYLNPARLAPNSIIALFGQGLANSVVVGDTIPLPTQLGDTIVRVIDRNNVARDAQLFFASPNQINFLVPGNTPTGNATVQVRVAGSLFADQAVTITATVPGLFTANANGQGVPTATLLRVKPDSQQIFEAVATFDGAKWNPIPLDVGPDADQLFLILYGTGLRGVSSLDQVQLKIGDQSAPALFAGAQGQLVGLDQINLNLTGIRAALRGRGEVTLTGTIGGQTVNPLTLRFQ